MRLAKTISAFGALGIVANLSALPAQAQTTLEPLPPLPPVESLYPVRAEPALRTTAVARTDAIGSAATATPGRAADRSTFAVAVTRPASIAPRAEAGHIVASSIATGTGTRQVVAPATPSLAKPTAVAVVASSDVAPQPTATFVAVPTISAPMISAPTSSAPTPSVVAAKPNLSLGAIATAVLTGVLPKQATLSSATSGFDRSAPRTSLSVPTSALVGAVRIGAATGGPALRDVVPSDVSTAVFTSASDVEPVAGWFTRTYRAALKRGGLLASKPENARYELTAEVRSMAITPMVAGVHHQSIVTYRLRDIANGASVWERTQTANLDVNRGFRFGALGGALGAALGGALAGQNPAITSQMITNQRGHRPFDVRIDVYEGIMRGFQEMARDSVAELGGPSAAS